MLTDSLKQRYKLNLNIGRTKSDNINSLMLDIGKRKAGYLVILFLTLAITLLISYYIFSAGLEFFSSAKYGSLEVLKNNTKNKYLQILIQQATRSDNSSFINNSNFLMSAITTGLYLNNESIANKHKELISHALADMAHKIVGGTNRKLIYLFNFCIDLCLISKKSYPNSLMPDLYIRVCGMKDFNKYIKSIYAINLDMLRNIFGWLRSYSLCDIDSTISALSICINLLGSEVSRLDYLASEAPDIDINKLSDNDKKLAVYTVTNLLYPNSTTLSDMDNYGTFNLLSNLLKKSQQDGIDALGLNSKINLIPFENILWHNLVYIYKFMFNIKDSLSLYRTSIIPEEDFMSALERDIMSSILQHNYFINSFSSFLSNIRGDVNAKIMDLRINNNNTDVFDHITQNFDPRFYDNPASKEVLANFLSTNLSISPSNIKSLIKYLSAYYWLENTVFMNKDNAIKNIVAILSNVEDAVRSANLKNLINLKGTDKKSVEDMQVKEALLSISKSLDKKSNFNYQDLALICRKYINLG